MVAALTPDVLASPALPLLLDLEGLGCRVEMTDRGWLAIEPASRLTAEQRAQVYAYAEDLALLVRCADLKVAERRDSFRRQIATARAGTLPLLLFRPGVPYTVGVCFSCADRLPVPRYGRCWRCALAWRLACRLAVPRDLAAALDEARFVA